MANITLVKSFSHDQNLSHNRPTPVTDGEMDMTTMQHVPRTCSKNMLHVS